MSNSWLSQFVVFYHTTYLTPGHVPSKLLQRAILDSGVPKARFSRLYDMLKGLVVQADMACYETSERELASGHLLHLLADDLVLYYHGYPAFWLLAYHHEEKRHYCMRVRKDFHSEVKDLLDAGDKSRVVMLKPNRA